MMREVCRVRIEVGVMVVAILPIFVEVTVEEDGSKTEDRWEQGWVEVGRALAYWMPTLPPGQSARVYREV